jgi:hypothetical protein
MMRSQREPASPAADAADVTDRQLPVIFAGDDADACLGIELLSAGHPRGPNRPGSRHLEQLVLRGVLRLTGDIGVARTSRRSSAGDIRSRELRLPPRPDWGAVTDRSGAGAARIWAVARADGARCGCSFVRSEPCCLAGVASAFASGPWSRRGRGEVAISTATNFRSAFQKTGSLATSFNDFVGCGQHRRRNGEAEGFCGLQIDD